MRIPATAELEKQDPRHAARARYISPRSTACPHWTNTEVHYFRVGEEMFASMCDELRQGEEIYLF